MKSSNQNYFYLTFFYKISRFVLEKLYLHILLIYFLFIQQIIHLISKSIFTKCCVIMNNLKFTYMSFYCFCLGLIALLIYFIILILGDLISPLGFSIFHFFNAQFTLSVSFIGLIIAFMGLKGPSMIWNVVLNLLLLLCYKIQLFIFFYFSKYFFCHPN